MRKNVAKNVRLNLGRKRSSITIGGKGGSINIPITKGKKRNNSGCLVMIFALIMIVIFLFLGTNVYSQSRIGIKGGYGLSYFTNNTDHLKRIAPLLGLIGHFPINKSISIQAEIIYSLKGAGNYINDQAKYGGNGFADTVLTRPAGVHRYDYELNFLEIPILFRYNVKGFYANAGVSLSFLVFGKKKYDWYFDSREKIYEKLDNLTGIDIPFIVSFGYEWKFKKERLFVEARFTKGNINAFTDSNYKLNNASISGGFYF